MLITICIVFEVIYINGVCSVFQVGNRLMGITREKNTLRINQSECALYGPYKKEIYNNIT